MAIDVAELTRPGPAGKTDLVLVPRSAAAPVPAAADGDSPLLKGAA
jgi:hypothetical protein